MSVVTLDNLAVALKGAAMTLEQIQALDTVNPLCSMSLAALQALRSRGDVITVTTNASGQSLYQITA